MGFYLNKIRKSINSMKYVNFLIFILISIVIAESFQHEESENHKELQKNNAKKIYLKVVDDLQTPEDITVYNFRLAELDTGSEDDLKFIADVNPFSIRKMMSNNGFVTEVYTDFLKFDLFNYIKKVFHEFNIAHELTGYQLKQMFTNIENRHKIDVINDVLI